MQNLDQPHKSYDLFCCAVAMLHELCHLKIKSHSHHFWDLVYRFMPNYYDRLEWLKANGTNLL